MSQPSTPIRVSKGRLLAVAAVAVVSCTAAVAPAMAQAADGKRIVVAEFRDVSPILTGNDVKLFGVDVGQVLDIRLTEQNTAQLVLELDQKALPLHADARATVKPVSLLGERFVDLNTGSADAPLLPEGAPIPINQTGLQTDLDQVLNTFEGSTGQGLAAMVATLGEGLKGNGADVDAALKALAPSMQKTDKFVQVLRDQNAVLNRLVESVEPVARSLAQDNGKTIDNLVQSTTSLTTTTANNQAQLQNTLRELPGAFTSARGALGNLADAAGPTRDTLKSLRPVTDDLTQISDEILNFSDAADPALDSLIPVLDKGTYLLEEIQDVAKFLRELGPDYTLTAKGAQPIFRQASNNVTSVLDFVRNWALTTNGKDGLGHYFRAHLNLEGTSATGNLPPLPGGGNSPLFGRDPAPDSGQPDRSLKIPGMLSSKSPDGGITGLNPKQESGALGFMLGGGK
jgi:phospholipid/cholesterol/gamma-HCH transport system substrate-binding protein